VRNDLGRRRARTLYVSVGAPELGTPNEQRPVSSGCDPAPTDRDWSAHLACPHSREYPGN